MPKGRPATKPAAVQRVPRKQPYDAPRLKLVAQRIREQAARLAGLARAMQDEKLTVVIDGHAMLWRGLNQVDNFADNATRALRAAKTAKEGG